ncbi:hypothetical protein DBV05_g11764, partial [Lasiodiplodia theobromae]
MTMRDEYPIHTLGLIGCGKLGSALLQGLLLAPPPPTLQHIHITVRTPSSAAHIHSTFLSSPSTTTPIPVTLNTADPLTTCLAADAVILACKPTQHAAILGTPGIAAALAGKPLISLLGGVTEEQLAASLALSPPLSSPSSSSSASSPPSAAAIIVRAMPNAAAAVRRSTTLLASSAFAPAPAASGNGGTAMMKDAIVRLFATLGSSTAPPRVVSPSTLEAAAVVAASGPAFFARVVGAVADELHSLLLAERTGCAGGAEDANAAAELALQLAAGAMGGAAALVEQGGWSAEEVERRVASVGGSTEKGLGVLGER